MGLQIEYNAKGDVMVNLTDLENRIMSMAEDYISDAERFALEGHQEAAEILTHKSDVLAAMVLSLEKRRMHAIATLPFPKIDIPDTIEGL